MKLSPFLLLFLFNVSFAETPPIPWEERIEQHEEGEPTDDELDDASYTDNLEVDPPLDTYVPPPPVQPVEPLENLTIDLKNPSFSQGAITTEEGGVITGQGVRIQAQKIEYVNRVENGLRVQKIYAEGNLMLEYAGRAFVGSRLEYDLVSNTGTLWEGKTFVDIWFLGGDRIELQSDGSFYISNAYVTTSESQENSWEIDAKRVEITKEQFLSAKNIRFRFFKVPLFWVPAFKSNLRVLTDPPIRYKLVWDKGLGPRLTMRYRVFSWRDVDVFFRLDYRIKRGFGAAIESEYFTPDGNTTFVTRNYAAKDKTFPDERGPNRYRLQGLYHTQSKDEGTQLHVTWDKLSDTRMVGDFRSDDFEINTQKRTRLLFTHQLDSSFFRLSVQPRLNNFQSIDKELPLFSIGIRPFEIGNSGIMMNNYVNAGYLDYVYASDLRHQFHLLDLSSSTHAIRLQTLNELYRPFSFLHCTVTPSIGISGIFYNNSPQHHSAGQGVLTYGFRAETRVWRPYGALKHLIEPYLHFQGLTTPTSGINHHFYFDINDGYAQLNQMRVGVRNHLFYSKYSAFSPFFSADLFTNAFFGNRTFAQVFPKSYLTLSWNQRTFSIKSGIAWNNEEQLWDFANVSTEWTINEDFAFAFEFRHRSKFDWRKGNHQNFILDVARPIPELLASPLSDGRDTFLARFFLRLSPKWTCHVQSRHGWGRKNEPRYNAGKVDLFTMLTCSWRLRLSYERMPNDNRFSGALSLVK